MLAYRLRLLCDKCTPSDVVVTKYASHQSVTRFHRDGGTGDHVTCRNCRLVGVDSGCQLSNGWGRQWMSTVNWLGSTVEVNWIQNHIQKTDLLRYRVLVPIFVSKRPVTYSTASAFSYTSIKHNKLLSSRTLTLAVL